MSHYDKTRSMKISQLNSRTLLIEKEDVVFLVPYFFHWNGKKREPESVILKSHASDVFFLTSIIKDNITETENGFFIERKWSIVPGGDIRLTFCIITVVPEKTPFLFPCLYSGNTPDPEGIAFLGERLSHPSGIYLFPGDKGIFISTDLPGTNISFSSVKASRTRIDKYRGFSTEILFPPEEEFPGDFYKGTGYTRGPSVNIIRSRGNLVRETGINVIIAGKKKIFPISVSVIHDKLKEAGVFTATPPVKELNAHMEKGIKKAISECLMAKKDITGLLRHKESQIISLKATVSMALLIRMMYKQTHEYSELSLILADFCLKNQHPGGFFFSHYYLNTGSCFTKEELNRFNNKGDTPYCLSLNDSAEISYFMLTLAGELKKKGLPFFSYFIAAKKFIDTFFNPRDKFECPGGIVDISSYHCEKPDLTPLYLVFPLLELFRLTGELKYKNAALSLKKQYFPVKETENLLFSITTTAEEQNFEQSSPPDFNSALLLLQTANIFEELGDGIKDKKMLINSILPWIYYNTGASKCLMNITGGILDSFSRCRILFRGYELAYSLFRIKDHITDTYLINTLEKVAGDLLAFAGQDTPGLESIKHTLWSPPEEEEETDFNTLVFTREAFYFLKLSEEYSQYL